MMGVCVLMFTHSLPASWVGGGGVRLPCTIGDHPCGPPMSLCDYGGVYCCEVGICHDM